MFNIRTCKEQKQLNRDLQNESLEMQQQAIAAMPQLQDKIIENSKMELKENAQSSWDIKLERVILADVSLNIDSTDGAMLVGGQPLIDALHVEQMHAWQASAITTTFKIG